VYGVAALALVLVLAAAAVPSSAMPRLHALAQETLTGGLGGMVLAALLLALTSLLGTLALTTARQRHAMAPPAESSSPRWTLADPGFAARRGQALIIPLGALLVWIATRVLWPHTSVAHQPLSGNIAAAFVIAMGFVSLICERLMNEFPAAQLPEAPHLRRQLLLVTVLLVLAGCIQFARGAQQAWVYWPELVVLCVPAAVALELALRALARLFLPPPLPADARAVADSIVVTLLTGGPRAPANLLRTHFGLDFARSWALSFLSAAALPALFGSALLCWGLSGLKLIDLSHRGVYERFGAPVEVLGPGVHLLLPWPFGRLRSVEYGAIHSVAIGVDAGESRPAPTSAELAKVSDAQLNAALEAVAREQEVSLSELPATFAAEGIDYTQYRQQLREQLATQMAGNSGAATAETETPYLSAEATPPLSQNRLWTTVHADQAHYLVASPGTGEQGFQSVSTEIYVLYRVGLTNQAALQSVYTVTDPGALVRESASRLVLRYFNSRTLEEVLGAKRENVADTLRDELAKDIQSYHAGIDIVSVLIEEIHPPEGAAEAWHAVQAAQINASASIADEQGRAKRAAGVAQQEAHELLAAATASATETRDAANAQAYRFAADQRAYQMGGRSFLLERLYTDFSAALKGKPMTIMDHRLSPENGPIIDLRPIGSSAPAAAGAGGATASPPAPAPAPGFQFEPAFSNAD
jgi:regulator of protease activity HflC (stomatin/prohibitin superfamily)